MLRFIDDTFEDGISPTIGVDFKLKHVVVNKQKLKLALWDTGAPPWALTSKAANPVAQLGRSASAH